MRRAALATAASVAAGLAMPPGAGAATVRATATSFSAGVAPLVTLDYTAAAGEQNNLTVSVSAAAPGEVTLRDDGAPLNAGPGCDRSDEHTVVCSPRRLIQTGPAPSVFEDIDARLGDGADRATARGDADVSLRGEGGDDVLAASNSGTLFEGGPGRDTMTGGDGPDFFIEGGESARDDIDGGTGTDELSYAGRQRAVSVDLTHDRGADGDRVRRVENVVGGRRNDRLVGNAHGNTLDGGPGNDVVLGLGRPDKLIGGGGTDVLSGGAGRDTLDVGGSERRPLADQARCGRDTDVVADARAVDRLARDCEWAEVQPGPFDVLATQPLRAGRSGVVEIRLRVPKVAEPFRGRVSLRHRGILLGRPSPAIALAPGGHTTARVDLVGPALTRLVASRRLTVVVGVNDAAFTTVLRAPLTPPTNTGGTPA